MYSKKCNNKAIQSSILAGSHNVGESAVENLTDALQALEKLPFPAGNRVALMGSGFGHMDLTQNTGLWPAKLCLPDFWKDTREKIKKVFPHAAYCRNPVNLDAVPDARTYAAVLEVLLESVESDILVCQGPFDMAFAAGAGPEAKDALTEKISRLLAASCKPVLFYCSPEKTFQCPRRDNIVGFPTISRVIRAARFLVDFRNTLELKIMENELASAFSYS